jgi:hypothetical protein
MRESAMGLRRVGTSRRGKSEWHTRESRLRALRRRHTSAPIITSAAHMTTARACSRRQPVAVGCGERTCPCCGAEHEIIWLLPLASSIEVNESRDSLSASEPSHGTSAWIWRVAKPAAVETTLGIAPAATAKVAQSRCENASIRMLRVRTLRSDVAAATDESWDPLHRVHREIGLFILALLAKNI